MLTGQLGYVTAAYAITALVMVGVTAWVLVDRAKQKATLKRLEEAGIARQDSEQS